MDRWLQGRYFRALLPGLLAVALLGGGVPLLSAQAAEGKQGPEPRVWMCRKDPWQLGDAPDAWRFVRQHGDVIIVFIDNFRKASVAEMRRFAEVVNGSGMAVAVECAGLCDWRARFGDQAAEKSFEDEYGKVRLFVTPIADGGAGGRIRYLQMDDPFNRMLYQKIDGKPTRTTYQTIDTAADQLVKVMRLWRQKIPDLQFYLGTNFGNWGYDGIPAYHAWAYTGQGKMGRGDYKPVVVTAIGKTREAGIPLAGVTVDDPYDYACGAFPSNQPEVTRGVDWIGRIRDLEEYVEGQGLEFGLIFNSQRAGLEKTGSDELYSRETLAYIDLYRARGGAPRNYIIESWYPLPSAYLPETTPYTMTNLVKEVLLKVKPELRTAR